MAQIAITKESKANDKLLKDLPFFLRGTTAKIRLKKAAKPMSRLVTK